MQTKSCESDALPADLLKKSPKGNIKGANHHKDNEYVSLEMGYLHQSGNTSIIRPLLKKFGLALTLSKL